MNPALLLLLLWSVRGRLVRSLRLLRQPRYLVGSLVFVAWLAMWAGPGALGFLTRSRSLAPAVPADALHLIQLGVAIALAAGLTVTWILPPSRLSLGLSAAEIELLSSAPVRRRELIQHAIVKNQAGILFGAAIMTLLMGVGGPLARLVWFVSMWLILTNGDLNGKARSLFKARLRELPRARALGLALLAVVIGLTFWGILLASVWGPVERLVTGLPRAMGDGAALEHLAAASAALEHGAHRILLAPLLWLLDPIASTFGGGPRGGRLLLSLVFGLTLALVQNEWVVRAQFKFEESALEHAQRESAKRDPRSRYRKISHARRLKTPFPLPPRGAPGAGLLWKSMLQVRRGSLSRYAAAAALLAGAVGLVPPLAGAPDWIPRSFIGVGLGILAISGWILPLHPRNDLRSDLLRLEVIRPWPVGARQIFGWEVVGPAIEGAIGAGFGACLILSCHAGMRLGGVDPQGLEALNDTGVTGPLALPLLVLALLPLAIALSFLTSTLVNLVALYMPGWVPLGPQKAKGAAAFGHNILLSMGLFLVSGIVLGGGALVVTALVLLQSAVLGWPVSTWELPLLGCIAALPAAAAAALGVRLGALLWADLDASREILDSTG